MANEQKTWLIVGASRGVGHEFVRQLLARGDRVYATIRGDTTSYFADQRHVCKAFHCDVTSEESISNFVSDFVVVNQHQGVDYVVLNAGVLKYPNRATELSFADFAFHLHTNTIGPIICAQKLLNTGIPIGTLVFISSDSGSAQRFNEFEDGFAAYAASKAALNQALRHMAAELKRKGNTTTTVLALHPGEVATDMANLDLGWDVVGQMSVQESVDACIRVVESKTPADSGSFWQWDGQRFPW